jgi:TonB-dependent starch-binding outer membrane protein SusC
MKYKIYKGLLRLTGYLWYGFIIQMIFYSSLFANGSNDQSVKSVREVVVTVEFQNDNFIAALNKIENMTAYRFSYNIDDIKSIKPINGVFSKVSLYDVLYNLSQQTEVKFRQIDENISIMKINKSRITKEELVEIV